MYVSINSKGQKENTGQKENCPFHSYPPTIDFPSLQATNITNFLGILSEKLITFLFKYIPIIYHTHRFTVSFMFLITKHEVQHNEVYTLKSF